MASNVDRPERAVQRVSLASITLPEGLTTLNLPDELSEIGECNFCGCPLDGGDASKRTVDFVRGVCVVSVSRALYRDGAYQPRTQTRRCDCALRRSAPLDAPRSARRTTTATRPTLMSSPLGGRVVTLLVRHDRTVTVACADTHIRIA